MLQVIDSLAFGVVIDSSLNSGNLKIASSALR
jgi:hypothetical protein